MYLTIHTFCDLCQIHKERKDGSPEICLTNAGELKRDLFLSQIGEACRNVQSRLKNADRARREASLSENLTNYGQWMVEEGLAEP